LSLIVLACVFVAAIALTVVTAVKSSDAYKMAAQRAKSDPRVIEAIGTPIGEGWWIAGNTEVSGGSGKADLTIPLHGPRGKAMVYALATKFAGDWQYTKLVVKIDKTGETIDLLTTAR